MLILTAKFHIKPDHQASFVAMAKQLIGPSRSEPGCICYEFYQDAVDPNTTFFFEKWDSRQALDQHFKQSYFKDFASTFPTMIQSEPSIQTYDVAGEKSLV